MASELFLKTPSAAHLNEYPSITGIIAAQKKQPMSLPDTGLDSQWAGLDSNQRRLTPTGLQPVPFSHSGTDPKEKKHSTDLKTEFNKKTGISKEILFF